MAIQQRESCEIGQLPWAAEGVFVHPLADVEPGAQLGAGTLVWRFAHVRAGAQVGTDCMLGNGVYLDAGAVLGNRVKVQNHVLVYAGVEVEDDVFLGPGVVFTNDLYPRAASMEWELTPTRVCRGASLGANATIVCGVTIGAYTLVAAGSVVTKDLPAHALVRGNPARHVGYVCFCGRTLEETAPTGPVTCTYCGQIVDLCPRHR
ncbi:MAG: acyltransferase [Armatimonadota bacterium]